MTHKRYENITRENIWDWYRAALTALSQHYMERDEKGRFSKKCMRYSTSEKVLHLLRYTHQYLGLRLGKYSHAGTLEDVELGLIVYTFITDYWYPIEAQVRCDLCLLAGGLGTIEGPSRFHDYKDPIRIRIGSLMPGGEQSLSFRFKRSKKRGGVVVPILMQYDSPEMVIEYHKKLFRRPLPVHDHRPAIILENGNERRLVTSHRGWHDHMNNGHQLKDTITYLTKGAMTSAEAIWEDYVNYLVEQPDVGHVTLKKKRGGPTSHLIALYNAAIWVHGYQRCIHKLCREWIFKNVKFDRYAKRVDPLSDRMKLYQGPRPYVRATPKEVNYEYVMDYPVKSIMTPLDMRALVNVPTHEGR